VDQVEIVGYFVFAGDVLELYYGKAGDAWGEIGGDFKGFLVDVYWEEAQPSGLVLKGI
jgi:hypothetical protein